MGYIRFPTINADTVVFGYEDDLWSVAADGGTAIRLTAGVAEARNPRFSPNGEWIAYGGSEEGPQEVFVMPAGGGDAVRLTHGAVDATVLGWSPDSEHVLFGSSANTPMQRVSELCLVPVRGGPISTLPYGMATSFAYGPDGAAVLGRFARREPAYWQRYRGGEAGTLWIDEAGTGEFRPLLPLPAAGHGDPVTAGSNMVSPCWVGGDGTPVRIFFLSDHEGIGNVYSVSPDGTDLQKHSEHTDFYARNLTTDGTRLVYHRSGELWLLDPAEDGPRRIPVRFGSSRAHRARRFVAPMENLDSWSLGPDGSDLAITTRGKAFSFGHWDGPVSQHGEPDGTRHRLLRWLPDHQRLVATVADEHLEERLAVLRADGSEPPVYHDTGAGRAIELVPAPATNPSATNPEDRTAAAEQTGNTGQNDPAGQVDGSDDSMLVALINHRSELGVVDLAEQNPTFRVLDSSREDQLSDLTWSPDGRWLAYTKPLAAHRSAVMLCEVETGIVTAVTDPVLTDHSPSFDPEGRYLYFLGSRELDPVQDAIQFDFGFPSAAKPYLVTLRAEDQSPFVREPKPLVPSAAKTGSGPGAPPADTEQDGEQTSEDSKQKDAERLRIDLENITERVIALPAQPARYLRIAGIAGKVLLLSKPIQGALSASPYDTAGRPTGVLEVLDLEKGHPERLLDGLDDFVLDPTASTLAYRSGSRLRVLKAGEKPAEEGENATRATGWVDLDRVKVSVRPGAEWRQMFTEAWRMQRDHFWNEQMSGADWARIHERYLPLVDRVATRSELSDLIWEFQGELGTSHAYELGGAYRQGPNYRQGFLGADWEFDNESGQYRIGRLLQGDRWNEENTSPLHRPGIDVRAGDAVVAINGQPIGRLGDRHVTPGEPLVNQAGQSVRVTIRRAEEEPRTVTVRALSDERNGRYRDWVNANRAYVAERTEGRIGYIHVPDMVGRGYAEFHRAFLVEFDREGLIVDVRFNGGGAVSGLLLQKLARRRMAYDFSRWFTPKPFPEDAPRGAMVALTNELAGSDGDIFSHAFKLMRLGTLVGKRTWGGTIGIWPRHNLADGTITTQPEFSFAFDDIGWGLENHGAEPDVEVENAPQDYAKGIDPQLDKAIELAVADLEARPPHTPRRPS